MSKNVCANLDCCWLCVQNFIPFLSTVLWAARRNDGRRRKRSRRRRITGLTPNYDTNDESYHIPLYEHKRVVNEMWAEP